MVELLLWGHNSMSIKQRASDEIKQGALAVFRAYSDVGHPLHRAIIPFLNQPCTLSASLAVRLYCRRFAFAFTIDLEME